MLVQNEVICYLSVKYFVFYLLQVYIAAFAISGYSTATFRNRYKPFNPVLGETYECIREDRGFRLISEQVSKEENLYTTSVHIHW